MLLGRRDVVAPFEGGRALAERGRIPPENLFLQRRGHFSVSVSLGVETAPVDRPLDRLRDKGAVIRESSGGSPRHRHRSGREARP